MKIRPIIGEYEIPRIQRIGTVENRRLLELAVPGLEGSYHQNVGRSPVSVVIEGTLATDQEREDFLNAIRNQYNAGEPVDFVADITTATETTQVIITSLNVQEAAGIPDGFRYSIKLAQYVEPPDHGALGDLSGLDTEIDLEAADLFDLMELPDLLGAVPDLSDPTPPLKEVLNGVKSALDGLGGATSALNNLFGSRES